MAVEPGKIFENKDYTLAEADAEKIWEFMVACPVLFRFVLVGNCQHYPEKITGAHGGTPLHKIEFMCFEFA